MINPKFEETLKDNIIAPQLEAKLTSTYGLVVGVDSGRNTVDVWIAGQGNSHLVSEMLFKVPFPVSMGIQAALPKVGMMCWVDFKGNDYASPVVTHFYNPVFKETQERKQNQAINTTPRFLFRM